MDINWLRPNGKPFSEKDWFDGVPGVSFVLRGEAGEYHLTPHGEPQPDASFFIILNPHHEDVDWTLPAISAGIRWRLLIDTNIDDALTDNLHHDDGQSYPVASRSTVVFVREEDPSKIPAISV